MKRLLGLGFVLASALACASAIAAEETEGQQVNMEGMRAYVDPVTGKLVSPPADKQAGQVFQPRMELIEEIKHANGMTEWKFNGQANESIIGTVSEDGTVAAHCAGEGTKHSSHSAHGSSQGENQ